MRAQSNHEKAHGHEPWFQEYCGNWGADPKSDQPHPRNRESHRCFWRWRKSLSRPGAHRLNITPKFASSSQDFYSDWGAVLGSSNTQIDENNGGTVCLAPRIKIVKYHAHIQLWHQTYWFWRFLLLREFSPENVLRGRGSCAVASGNDLLNWICSWGHYWLANRSFILWNANWCKSFPTLERLSGNTQAYLVWGGWFLNGIPPFRGSEKPNQLDDAQDTEPPSACRWSYSPWFLYHEHHPEESAKVHRKRTATERFHLSTHKKHEWL